MLTPRLKEIFAVAAELPAAPQVLSELAELLQDINAETGRVCALLRQDGALAAAILRMANSPYYGTGGIGSIDGAVNRVGFREVHRLVGFAVTGLLADRALPFYRVEPEMLREHMITTALAAESLAGSTAINPRHAYTAGLLRPVGMMVLDRMARSSLGDQHLFSADRDSDYGTWESRVMQIRNAAVSAVVMTEWRFSPDVVEAVRGHLLTPGATSAPTPGAALIHLACAVTAELGLGLPGETDRFRTEAGILELAGVSAEQFAATIEETKARSEELRAAYSAS